MVAPVMTELGVPAGSLAKKTLRCEAFSDFLKEWAT